MRVISAVIDIPFSRSIIRCDVMYCVVTRWLPCVLALLLIALHQSEGQEIGTGDGGESDRCNHVTY